jgi:hypothetical protein
MMGCALPNSKDIIEVFWIDVSRLICEGLLLVTLSIVVGT